MEILALSLYSISFAIQITAVFYSLIIAHKSPRSLKWGWIFLSLGLFLMLGRRISPIASIMDDAHFNIVDAIFFLLISTSLLIGIIGINQFMLKIQSNDEFLNWLSGIDPLTKCSSRSEILFSLVNEIKRSERNGNPLSILELDLDFFKNVNDQRGHDVGDEVLCEFATCIKKHLRVNDHFGRIGGDEFLIILPETGKEAALLFAERIRKKVGHTPCFPATLNEPIKVTVSIGIANFDPNGPLDKVSNISKALLKRADMALYQAKANGRNQVLQWQKGP